jgi:acetyl coenzyme A synthetase (ADP forming)-like protein
VTDRSSAPLDRDGDDWEGDVVLADGATMRVRAMRADDEPLVARMYERLSDDSVYLRFFSPVTSAMATALEMNHLGEIGHVALVALLGAEIVAAARYDIVDPGVAEVAFVVADEHQGRGVGTLLLEHLAVIGRSRGIHTFTAQTLACNPGMLRVFAAAGWARDVHIDAGTVVTRFSIAPTEASLQAISEREHRAEAASVARLLAPRSVAVIGASRAAGKIGHAVMQNLRDGGFHGSLYAVNPNAASVAGVPAFASILEIPEPVDVAVIVRPAPEVPELVEQCARKAVHGLVVLAAGFAELDANGAALQRTVVSKARANGMRVIGPNCLGIANPDPDVRLNATFAPTPPIDGNVAFLSQSGGLGIELLSQAARRGIGISEFVSVGNKGDVSGNDLLQFWEDDPRTDVILLYLESFGNPGKFARIARRISRRKPIIAVKAGRTPAGSRAASSHTAALASSDVAVDALFAQAGVIRVDTLEDLLDTAQLLAAQPVPAGNRVAVVTNAGGPGILAADACAGAGLELLPRTAQSGEALPNPLDLGGAAPADWFGLAVADALRDDTVDAVLVVYAPPIVTDATAVARAVAAAAARAGAAKPIAACFLGDHEVGDDLRGIPVFAFPEAAARALGRATELGRWRIRPPGEVPQLDDIDPDAVRQLIAGRLAVDAGGGWLDSAGCGAVLDAYGIPAVESRSAADAAAAAAAARELGFPVALKVGDPAIVHKSDRGGVALGLAEADAVRRAYHQMHAEFGDGMGGAIVQRMARPGLEVIVGITQDPLFGPLLLFGAGGVAAELLADRALRILPLSTRDAGDLVRSLRTSPLLFGYRGSPPLAVDALEQLLLRVARLAEDVPEITEMDLNPVVVYEDEVIAVDTKVRYALAPRRAPADLRRMRD